MLARKRAVSHSANNSKHMRARARDVCRVLFVCMASRLNWDFGLLVSPIILGVFFHDGVSVAAKPEAEKGKILFEEQPQRYCRI